MSADLFFGVLAGLLLVIGGIEAFSIWWRYRMRSQQWEILSRLCERTLDRIAAGPGPANHRKEELPMEWRRCACGFAQPKIRPVCAACGASHSWGPT